MLRSLLPAGCRKALALVLGVWVGLLLVSRAHAGFYQWTSNGPEGGTIAALALNPQTPTTLYAGTFHGVFKSTNSGSSWTAANTGLTATAVRALALDPQMPTTLYAGTFGGGVFKSTNSGGNWSPFNTGLTNLTVNAVALSPSGIEVHAGTAGGGVFDFSVFLPIERKYFPPKGQ